MVELRKRKAPTDTLPPSVKKANSIKSSTSNKKGDPSTNGSPATRNRVAAGDIISIDDFGGEVETNDGEKVSLKRLLDQSESGVVLFTYPKASTVHHLFNLIIAPSIIMRSWNLFLVSQNVFLYVYLTLETSLKRPTNFQNSSLDVGFPLPSTLSFPFPPDTVLAVYGSPNWAAGLITSLILLGTTQVCLFRDEFMSLTTTGYNIYGLSTDSPKSNTTFKTRQSLPYILRTFFFPVDIEP